jgi:hypothetical protein
MTKVIINKLTGEHLADTPENRIATYRTEFNSDYHKYKEKYEIISYGCAYTSSSIDILKKYNLLDKHNEQIKKACNAEAEREKQEREACNKKIEQQTTQELINNLKEIYAKLDSYSQVDALGTIEDFKECARYCDTYR